MITLLNKVKLNQYKKLGKLKNCIYLIQNPEGTKYIGKFININRIHDYLNFQSCCKQQIKIFNSLRKYGVSSHTIEIIKTIPKSSGLDGLQKLYISIYNTYKNGLNMTLGGETHYKYSDQFCNIVYQMNKNGKNCSNIAKQLNLSVTSIINFIKRTGNDHIKYKNNHKLFAIDQHLVLKKVYPIAFIKNKRLLSQWHNQCYKMSYSSNHRKKRGIVIF